MTPLTWVPKSAMRLVSNSVIVGSTVGFSPDIKIFKLVSGMYGFVQLAATWFLEGQARQIR